MKSVLKKKFNKKGFTLAELLVVVAIIAVLVAIALPVFGGKLTEAESAVQAANLRAARAEASADYLMNSKSGELVYKYDVKKGGEMKIQTGYPKAAETGDAEGCVAGTGDVKYVVTVILNGTSYDSAIGG